MANSTTICMDMCVNNNKLNCEAKKKKLNENAQYKKSKMKNSKIQLHRERNSNCFGKIHMKTTGIDTSVWLQFASFYFIRIGYELKKIANWQHNKLCKMRWTLSDFRPKAVSSTDQWFGFFLYFESNLFSVVSFCSNESSDRQTDRQIGEFSL